MALRNIMNYKTDDILRKKAKSVEKINDRILTLLDDMAETMYASNGVGLAGPQVGVLKRVAVIDVGSGLIKLINPVIEKAEGEVEDTEGCLSLPQLYGKVKRPQKVVVKAINEQGKNVKLEGSDLLARAFCHEIDHLDGVLFIDKVIKGTLVNIGYNMAQKDEK